MVGRYDNWRRYRGRITLKVLRNGHIAEGTLLTENQMAKQFNVSRSPIRDAFKLLQQNQLIQLERMGAHVLPFGSKKRKKCMICD